MYAVIRELNFSPTWFMHDSCHENALQLSCNHIAIVMQSHRNCHVITCSLLVIVDNF